MSIITAIVVAGGSGRRFGAPIPKQFVPLAGKSVLQHALELFEQVPAVDQTILVLAPEYLESYTEYVDLSKVAKFQRAVGGGKRRQDSVWNGLRQAEDAELVAVHDAARPLADPRLIQRACELAEQYGGAILAAVLDDTVKRGMMDEGEERNRVEETLDRASLWRAQTPQIFRRNILQDCYQETHNRGIELTDEAQALELCGEPIMIVESPWTNLKITTRQDLDVARALLKAVDKSHE